MTAKAIIYFLNFSDLTEINNVKQLIAKDKLNTAMDKILGITKTGDGYNAAILISLKLIIFQKMEIKGSLDWGEASRIRVGIASQMLQLVDWLEKDDINLSNISLL